MSHMRVVVIVLAAWLVLVGSPALCQQRADATRYKEFGRRVEQITLKMKEVAEGRTEKDDLRALEFLLRDYNEAVTAQRWKKANSVARSMHVYLVRGGAVASEAEKRKASRARADAERRHREELRQRERHHREAMRQAEEQQRIQQYLFHLYGW